MLVLVFRLDARARHNDQQPRRCRNSLVFLRQEFYATCSTETRLEVAALMMEDAVGQGRSIRHGFNTKNSKRQLQRGGPVGSHGREPGDAPERGSI